MSSELPKNKCLPSEVVTRYLVSKKHYRTSDLRVKHQAFEPSARDGATSVFRIQGLTEDQIWHIGLVKVASPRERTLYARADLKVSEILRANLGIKPKEPPPRHANIIGWPDEKPLRMVVAQQLAAEATLNISPLS